MEFSSINIHGNIISSEILIKIRNEDIKFQHASDFLLDKKTTARDEIGIAWAATRAHYTAFKLRVDRLKESDSGASETRNSWMLPLFRELGYDVEKATAFIHPDTQKSYAISHKAANLNNFPIHIMGVKDDLDRRRENSGPRLSPHALTQEYLNNTEHTYAIVTNGKYLRLLRDATRLVRLSYLEFDLEKMMDEDLYADFAVLFRLLHATRMPKHPDQLEESFIEYYHQESLASGSRIREKLSKAVESSIKSLANGFLHHPANEQLRTQVQKGQIPAADFYLSQLRLIYRFLFLIVTEERNLVYPDTKDPDVQRKRKIYYDFYSIERLRKLAAKLYYVDGRKSDLWEGLKSTFILFEKGYYGSKLNIKPLGSGLFSSNALGELPGLKLGNEDLLRVIRNLTLFENDNKQWVRVNYSDLDVEEFGSVYEGLLEYDAEFADVDGSPLFRFKAGSGRSSSGAHYTPEELVKPLIKHSLDYLVEEKLKEPDPEKALLNLKVCDLACGSGHILLSAARRIAFELACIRETKAGGGKEKVEQPSPKFLRAAIRDAIKHCIYGVDKNPLAVELCKVALWLEAHNPGEPLNFLDHHIKCGDAIIGLAHKDDLMKGIADEAFKALTEEEKEAKIETTDAKGNLKWNTLASSLANQNKKEKANRSRGQGLLEFEGAITENMDNVFEAFEKFDNLPETTPDEIEAKEKAYHKLVNGGAVQRIKTISDIQVGQFFVSKTLDKKDRLVTDAPYFRYLKGEKPVPQTVLAETIYLSNRRFFHWFIEFPEVFQRGGFDCVLGNPPFLGGQKLSGAYGNNFLEYVKYAYNPIGAVDLVTYFFRRIFSLLKPNGFQSLISTNTIAQGSAREGGLDVICSDNGIINHAVRSMRWPGQAAVEVSLVTIHKGSWNKDIILDNKKVDRITPYLDDSEVIGNPFPLKANAGKSFQGSIVLGKGFVISPEQAEILIAKDKRNKEVLFPYLNGDDLNNDPQQQPSRWVINFFDWPENKARSYPECFEIVEKLVKPERMEQNDKGGKEQWWRFLRPRKEMYETISQLDQVMVSCRVSKYVNQSLIPNKSVFDVTTNVISRPSYFEYAFLQSSIHEHWAWKYASTLESRIRYLNIDCIDTFPIPQKLPLDLKKQIEHTGESYFKHRSKLMSFMGLGLTKTYNMFHAKGLKIGDIIKATKKTESESEKAFEGITELRNLHFKMNELILSAYEWDDIKLNQNFYEMDYLPENDRIRYTIHPNARKEILKRLLQLNQKLHAEEIAFLSTEKKKKINKSSKTIDLFSED